MKEMGFQTDIDQAERRKNLTASSSSRVLVIDDNSNCRLLIRQALELYGFIVYEAENGEKGLESYLAKQPDILLLDFMMPVMDGFETCSWLQDLPGGNHVPVLMMTGLDDYDAIGRAYQAGATDFIIKPINCLLLAYRLRYMLRVKEIADDLRKNEGRLATAQRVARMGYWELDIESREFHISNEIKTMLGLNGKVPIQTYDAFLQYVEYSDQSLLEENIVNAVDQKCGFILDHRMVCANRELINIQQVAEIVVDGVNHRTKLVGTLQDVTERKRNAIGITASAGICIYLDDGRDEETLLKHTRAALYNAEDSGGNGYTHSKDARPLKRLSLESSLRKALEQDQDQFQLYYQPKVLLSDDSVTSAEALIRWNHPDLGHILPGEFIPIAESTGLIVPLSEWVIKEACDQLIRWDDMSVNLDSVSVNLSAFHLSKQDSHQELISVFADTGLESSRLDIEITETVLMDNIDSVVSILHQFMDIGVSISIDDFGTGYSSLSYLKRLPISALKIDQSFIQDVINDGDDAIIVNTVITLAHSLGLKVVAEGVEDDEQLTFLQERNCDEAQGYFFSPPMPSDDFIGWLQGRQTEPLARVAM